jgi:hypothetical protein
MVRPPRPADEGASKDVFKVALFKMTATSKNPLFFIVNLLLLVVAEMGATNTASGRLEVYLFLSEKRGGKRSHFGIILVSAATGI